MDGLSAVASTSNTSSLETCSVSAAAGTGSGSSRKLAVNGCNESDDKNTDYGAIEFAPRHIGYRLRSIDILLKLDALGSQLECPRKQHGYRETNKQEKQDETAHPFGQRQHGHENIDDLKQQPGNDDVRYGYAKYVAAFQLVEYPASA